VSLLSLSSKPWACNLNWTVLAVISLFGVQVDGHRRALLESLSVRVTGEKRDTWRHWTI
jgi:hypothetical protein